jgi:hypothetical protein
MGVMRVPAVVPVLLCLVLTGCSSSDKGDEATPADGASATTTASAAASASAGASTQASASAVPRTGSGTTGDGGSAAPAASAGASASAATLRGTAPGDYTYDAVGSYSLGGAPQDAEGTATLTVSPLRDGRQTSTLHGEQGGDTVQDLVLRSDGVYLARLSIGTPVNKEFRPAAPVLLFPTPATVGRKWSWQATSTDGKSTVRTTNQVLRTETLSIGGEKVATAVLQSRLVITGEVTYTADVTTWVATAYRLPVKDHTKGNGKWGTVAFSTDVTSTMRSVHPA